MRHPRHAPAFYLPTPLTPLIGREREVANIQQRLRRVGTRLVSLTGPGGVGKTRLGLEVVRGLGADFADGVAFVSIAPIRDPALVIPTIAQALGLPEASNRRLLERLQAHLRHRQLLLYLDNFEQVATAAPQIAELLVTCPDLHIVVASRAVLHISGEQEHAVLPLALPVLKNLPTLEALVQIPSVALFIERALAVQPSFRLTPQNAAAVAGICVRLDGLPLAIELAAARVKLLSPQAILDRLASTSGARFQLLTGGQQDLPVRQQTLRATIAWSYTLLSRADQCLFRQLSSFVGGFTLETVEAVASHIPLPGAQEVTRASHSIVDQLMRLLDQSLIIPMSEPADNQRLPPRYTMLETIHEYGLEQLRVTGELDAIQQAHTAYYLAMAEEVEPKLTTAKQKFWKAWLEAEHDNLRAALRWLLDRHDVWPALRLSGALWWFWYRCGHWTEGRYWLDQTLSLPTTNLPEDTSANNRDWQAALAWRARALNGAGILAHYQGDYGLAATHSSESVAISRQLGDQRGVASALHGLALAARGSGNYATARTIYQESLALFRGLGERWHIAYTLFYLGVIFWLEGDYDGAEPFFGECLLIFNQLEDQQEIVYARFGLAQVAFGRGQYNEARTICEECLTIGIDLGDQRGRARYLYSLGDIAVELGDNRAASAYYREGLILSHDLGDRYTGCWCLDGLARVAIANRQLERATRLFGAAAALRGVIGTHQQPFRQAACERNLATIRAQLDATVFATAWLAGQTMPFEQAIQYALAEPTTPDLTVPPAQAAPAHLPTPSIPKATRDLDSLTSRELDVLRLIATGMTDAQVAETLIVSTRTVNAHLRSIYSKMGVTSRSAATRYALEHGLV